MSLVTICSTLHRQGECLLVARAVLVCVCVCVVCVCVCVFVCVFVCVSVYFIEIVFAIPFSIIFFYSVVWRLESALSPFFLGEIYILKSV